MKDKRTAFSYAKLTLGNKLWHIDGKYDPERKLVKVYRVHGDVSNRGAIVQALNEWRLTAFPEAESCEVFGI